MLIRRFRSPVIWISFALALLSFLGAGVGAAEESAAPDNAMAQMMAAWQRYAEVGAPQEALARRVGPWDATVKFWYAPGTPPEVSKASSHVELIMGGRYVLEHFNSTMPDGSAFEGMGQVGYDNILKCFVATWVDTMSSGIMVAKSTSASADFQRIEYTGQAPDPVAESYKSQRSVEYWVDESTRVMEAWETGSDGEEFKVMEITYVRK